MLQIRLIINSFLNCLEFLFNATARNASLHYSFQYCSATQSFSQIMIKAMTAKWHYYRLV